MNKPYQRLSTTLSRINRNRAHNNLPTHVHHESEYSSKFKSKENRSKRNLNIHHVWISILFISTGIVFILKHWIVSKSTFVYDLDQPISIYEYEEATTLLNKAKEITKTSLTPLRPIDKEKYTVRINAWRREAHLMFILKHLQTCQGIAQIQIIWCDSENTPSIQLLELINSFNANHSEIIDNYEFPFIIIENHEENSLNERFHVLYNTPTLGVLNMDDDVIAPCVAIDSGFYRWTDYPHRLVGFDYRNHRVQKQDDTTHNFNNTSIDNGDQWRYKPRSSSMSTNKYSMTLTRFAFTHVDYLNLYGKYISPRILKFIEQQKNCEDIAMSFFISALTDGKVPLLADMWATHSVIQLRTDKSGGAISGADDHKMVRTNCTNDFAFLLGLKDSMVSETIFHDDVPVYLSIGADYNKNYFEEQSDFSVRRRELIKTLHEIIDQNVAANGIANLVKGMRHFSYGKLTELMKDVRDENFHNVHK